MTAHSGVASVAAAQQSTELAVALKGAAERPRGVDGDIGGCLCAHLDYCVLDFVVALRLLGCDFSLCGSFS